MTLSTYLGLLSLGSTIQTRANAESQQEEQQEINALRRMAQHIVAAEIDTVSTVSTHNAPSERRGTFLNDPLQLVNQFIVEVRENITGVVLAISTMVANYSLCFPIVAARHRLQALPTFNSYQRDTPMYGMSMIYYTYKNGGVRRLYPGFGLGLIGQTISATYESGINTIMSSIIRSANKVNKLLGLFTNLVSKVLGLAINVPLYPLYRNALILRVQFDSPTTRNIISNFREFIYLYKRDLKAFWPSHPHHKQIMSSFIPSCALNILTEKLLIYIYRVIFRSVSNNPEITSKKKKDATVLHTFYPEMACGVISSIITRAISYPIDTVLFKLMVQGSGVLRSDTTYQGFFDCVKRTYREEGGWKAFYPGWGIGVLEVTMGYLILETAWLAYRATQWKLQAPGSSDTRAVRKARKLKERLL